MSDLAKFKAEHGEQDNLAAGILDDLKAYALETAEDADYIGQVRVELNRRFKEVETERKKIANPQHTAWKATNAFFKKFSVPLQAAVKVADEKLRGWEQKQLQAAQEAEREAQQAAREALAAKARGDAKAAAESFKKAQAAVAVSARPVAKAAGLQAREKWSAQVADMSAFLTFLAANPDMQTLITPDQATLDRLAREVRVEGAFGDLPGVLIVKTTTFAS